MKHTLINTINILLLIAPLPPPGPPKPSAPQPLMSLMGVPTNPPGSLSFGDSSPSHQNGAHPPLPKLPKPLFPSAVEYSNDLNHTQHVSQINDSNYVPKIENLPPGSKIIHPEDDISLVKLSFFQIKVFFL